MEGEVVRGRKVEIVGKERCFTLHIPPCLYCFNTLTLKIHFFKMLHVLKKCTECSKNIRKAVYEFSVSLFYGSPMK